MMISKKSKLAIVALIAVALALTFTAIPVFPAVNVNQNLSSSGTITTSPNVLGNFLHSGHYRLPAAHTHLRKWHKEMTGVRLQSISEDDDVPF